MSLLACTYPPSHEKKEERAIDAASGASNFFIFLKKSPDPNPYSKKPLAIK
jgi:hypothetical protein